MKLWSTKQCKDKVKAEPPVKPVKIHITEDAVWIDPKEFLAHPDVQKQLREYAKMDMAGKKL